MTKSNQDAADLHDHRNDEGEWSDEVEVIEVRPRRTEVISFRVPSEELDRIEEAAERAGQSLSQFIRAAVQMQLEGRRAAVQRIPVLDVMTGRANFVVNLHRHISSSMGEAPSSWVPDRPPVLVNITKPDG